MNGGSGSDSGGDAASAAGGAADAGTASGGTASTADAGSPDAGRHGLDPLDLTPDLKPQTVPPQNPTIGADTRTPEQIQADIEEFQWEKAFFDENGRWPTQLDQLKARL